MEEIKGAQALIMSAAVADFTPIKTETEKIKKDAKLSEIKLKRTSDIISEVGKLRKKNKLDIKIVGFAAESQNLKENAVKKLQDKGHGHDRSQ